MLFPIWKTQKHFKQLTPKGLISLNLDVKLSWKATLTHITESHGRTHHTGLILWRSRRLSFQLIHRHRLFQELQKGLDGQKFEKYLDSILFLLLGPAQIRQINVHFASVCAPSRANISSLLKKGFKNEIEKEQKKQWYAGIRPSPTDAVIRPFLGDLY